MNKTAAKALEESIAHWERLYAIDPSGKDARKQYRTEGYWSESCPLCKEYLNDICIGCPVYEYTKRSGCVLSPWSDAADTMDNPSVNTKKLVKRELDFLKSLRVQKPYIATVSFDGFRSLVNAIELTDEVKAALNDAGINYEE